MRSFAKSVAVPALAAALFAPSSAFAEDVEACVKASEQGQSMRDDGKYRAAREQFQVCTRDVCPGVVRKDCAQWLAEVEASMPSIVVNAKDAAGHDIVAVKVTLDGQVLFDKLDGKPVPIDPGMHTLRFETAGATPVEKQVVMHAGEKNRPLDVALGASKPAPTPTTTDEGGAKESSGARPPIAAYVVAGVGVLALGSFVYFGLSGKSDVNQMRQAPADGGCAPYCDQARVDSAKTKLLVADLSLGVGVVAAGIATYLFLSNHSPAQAAATAKTGVNLVDVKAVPGGGVAQIGGMF